MQPCPKQGLNFQMEVSKWRITKKNKKNHGSINAADDLLQPRRYFTCPAEHLSLYVLWSSFNCSATFGRSIVHRSCTCVARIIVKVVSCLPETSVGPQTDSCLHDRRFPLGTPVHGGKGQGTTGERDLGGVGVNHGAAWKTEEARDVAVM